MIRMRPYQTRRGPANRRVYGLVGFCVSHSLKVVMLNRLNVKLAFVNAWSYCFVAGLAMIVGSWKLMLLSIGCVLVSHYMCVKLEQEIRNGLHGAPKDPHQ